MPTQHPALIIEICGEKVVQRASKGRQQWLLLKQFHGRCVGDFTEAAKADTRRSPAGTYQQGSWWERELGYCLEKRVIRLVDAGSRSTQPAPVSVTSGQATLKANAEPMPPPLQADPARTPALALRKNSTVLDGQAGLYLVTLNNEDPISTNAADPRIADRCAKVNREHCKFGRARDFARRRGNYEETFEAHNVNFFPLAALADADLAAAERAVLQRLNAYKIRGPSGYRLEWLTDIQPEQVIEIVRATLRSNHISHHWLT